MIFIACYNPTFVQRTCKHLTGEVESKYIGGINALNAYNPWIKDVLKESYSGEKLDIFIPRFQTETESVDFIQIPCGKCIGCRMDYSRSWADRMTYHVFGKEENSWFITLTYDDDHLDELEHSDNYDLYSLNYDHISAFIKSLRNRFRDCQLDYYLSGEYGDQQFRPHFHAIVYNLPLDDLEFWKCNAQGDPIYTSDIIHSLWGKGICSVSPFNWHSAAYTARYVEKKRDGRMMCEYTAVGLDPEKCRCSRRPGIAHEYYLQHAVDLWNNNGLDVPRTVNSSGHLGIPRYFRKLQEKYFVDKETREDHREAHEAFLAWQKRCLERSNVLNPFKVDNSSFDLDRIQDMLKFEEREILSTKVNRKL